MPKRFANFPHIFDKLFDINIQYFPNIIDSDMKY